MTAKQRDFTTNVKTANEQIKIATQEPTKRKPRKTYTAAEAEQIKADLATQGRKGVKADRLNMAFSSENYDYVRVMAALKGVTMTKFVNEIIAKSLEDNRALYNQAKDFASQIK